MRRNVLWTGIVLLTWTAALSAQVGGSGTTNTIPLWTNTTTLGDSLLFQKSGNIGIGTKKPSAKLHIVASNKGALVVADNTSQSNSTIPIGAFGRTSAIGGIGVQGIASSTADDSNAAGVFGQSFGGEGVGVVGVATGGPCAATCPAGVEGVTTAAGAGVSANATNTTGPSNAVQAINYSPQGVGAAIANAGSGIVIAGYGGPSFTTVFTVDSAGNVFVKGNLSKGGGSFKIDHPLDPVNKYLSHSFVESPDMMNIYSGIVLLDANGEATVKLPDYFQALNGDFRYQLTAMGAPGPNLYIAEEISGNRFKIAGGKTGSRVSWQVTGVRHDAYADAHRIQVEEEKPAQERGHYLHPELFGAAEQAAIGASPQTFPVAPVAAATAGMQ